MANDSENVKSTPKDKLHLQIISPEGSVYDDLVDEVLLPSQKGEIGILPQHISLFTKLEQGEVTIKKGSNLQVIVIFGGFLEVRDNVATILSDYAVRADSIEIAKAEEAKKRAEEILKGKEETVDFLLAEKELQKSLLTLKSADKYRKRQRN